MDSEHTLDANARSLIRRGLSMLVDEYEKSEKKAEEKLGSESLRAHTRIEKEDILKLRSQFLEPGSLEEVEASQNDMFDGDETPTELVDDTPPEEDDEEEEDEEDEMPEPWKEPKPGRADD